MTTETFCILCFKKWQGIKKESVCDECLCNLKGWDFRFIMPSLKIMLRRRK